MEITRNQLVKAFHKWNSESLDNPNDYDDLSKDLSCAESQADHLIKLLEEESKKPASPINPSK